ncbi:putative sulfate exporter family transporter [Campylobacter lari]|uniref:putative sulfate exporter family transporter n=1 Tax=Campylobacter lari TaxID=201 RepID=UPI0012854D10|nr:putative sulfate exporter family transporter [Campylobacter lari]EAH8202159.1 putative sulfate exporter family transporter [Campylobacter lari]EAJ5674844.1 putative sulfate exporter family transporter [Campylobacter lari]EAJ6453128.1 putative sulfate exporter family transporter [Campylobacter lari]EAK0767127.1 putative sulfate exporter family transporter [Campylobacter lari]EAK5583918.1 putative sulfate exporter family transporter [Campylobacter lari]
MKWFKKEDVQAIFTSSFIIAIISILWMFDLNFIYKFIDIKFTSWNFDNIFEKTSYFSIFNIILFYIFFAMCFTFAFVFMKYDIKKYLTNFSIIFILSILTNFVSTHEFAKTWQLETPLIALIMGLLIGNIFHTPKWFKDTLTTEFYVKIGIILMGATLPLTLIIQAGSIAIIQACIITIITFFSIFFIATKFFKLDSRFGVTLGGGGSICSGYVYGLSIILSFMQNNNLKHGLLFTCDPYRKIIDDNDKNTSLLFGDGASVTYISKDFIYTPIAFKFGTDGSKFESILCKKDILSMNGRGVFEFSATTIPKHIMDFLQEEQINLNNVDRFIFHQGSKYIVDTLRQRLKLDEEKVPFDANFYGNTVSSSIPILLENEFKKEKCYNNILISGFGTGLSWASAILQGKK